MRMKTFEDLTSDIYDDTGVPSHLIQETLRWLDQHPNKTPQPTVVESKRDHWTKNQGEDYARGFQAGISALDGRVIPDPAPTNAEKIDSVLDGYFGQTADMRTNGLALSEYLDIHGVKAPEDE